MLTVEAHKANIGFLKIEQYLFSSLIIHINFDAIQQMPNVESRYELSEGSDLTEWWSVESDLKVTINASQVR